jgi:hypothetical protein
MRRQQQQQQQQQRHQRHPWAPLLALAVAASHTHANSAPPTGRAWSGPQTTPGVTGPGTASVIVDGESIPAHWFTGAPYNAYTGAPSRSPPPLVTSALVSWVSTVRAASAVGIRIFEPLLNQWQLDNSTTDGITNATSTLLDSALQIRSDALFVLRIHVCPEVAHMYRQGKNASDPPTDDGAHLPSPADPEWVPRASAGLIALLRAIDERYPKKIIGVHLTALQSGEWSQPEPAVGATDYSEAFRTLYCARMNETNGAGCVLPSTTERGVARTGTASVCAATPNTAANRAVGFNMLHNDDVSDVILGLAESVKVATDSKILVLIFYGYLQAVRENALLGAVFLLTVINSSFDMTGSRYV